MKERRVGFKKTFAGVDVGVHQPSADEISKVRAKTMTDGMKKIMPEGGIIWTASVK